MSNRIVRESNADESGKPKFPEFLAMQDPDGYGSGREFIEC